MKRASVQDETSRSADEAARLDGAVEQFIDLLARLVAERHWQEQHQAMEEDDRRQKKFPAAAS